MPLLGTFTGDPVGAVKPFDFMAAQAEGIKRLGILRMDVDDMGEMFVSGFGNRATLAHIASLSFAMSLFFEGWVEKLAQEVDGGKNLIYSIYSGGDDLFFVGAWHLMPELARRIRVDLERYTGGHPGVHASGGIVLVKEKYPLAQAAEDAGGAESKSKDLSGKDAITFLGRTVRWSTFGLDGGDTVMALKEKLASMKGSSALLRKLIEWQLMYEDATKKRREAGLSEDKIPWGPWLWQSAYFLSRMEKQQRDAGEKNLAEAIKDLRENKLNTSNFARSIDWIGLAARWAELSIRQGSREEA
jgi:CRISPR-associated protein Csm1